LPEPSIPTATSSWFGLIVRRLLALAILLAGAGFLYQNISETRDRRFHPMPGLRVDVGGYKMHLVCSGAGSPTVILDSGLGDSYLVWRKVQPQIAGFTQVCSYDRAGLGYSEASPHPRTSKDIAEELHTLLHNANIPAPYILAGHSMGGFDVRLYAGLYRREVAGMVLVDASHPDQKNRFPPAVNDLDAGWIRQAEFLEFAMPFGVTRLLGFCGSDAEVRAATCNFHTGREGVAELKAFRESAEQTASTGSLGSMPLAVLSHDSDKPEPGLPEDLVKPINDAWQQMQTELARLSARSTHEIARNSGHYIQIDRPDVVIDAVRKIVDEARQSPVTN
jgi:pimeloyl-ACP methyl ester carboxylesterase